MHPGFDAQRVVDQRQRLESGHEAARVAAVVAHREELALVDILEQALEGEVSVLREGKAVDGVGGEEGVLFFVFLFERGGGGEQRGARVRKSGRES